jgi:hypothetical protein
MINESKQACLLISHLLSLIRCSSRANLSDRALSQFAIQSLSIAPAIAPMLLATTSSSTRSISIALVDVSGSGH